ncbi:uncharacterized protein LOC144744985 [Ciona intestinalis]
MSLSLPAANAGAGDGAAAAGDAAAAGGGAAAGGADTSYTAYDYDYGATAAIACITTEDTGLDAYAWIKTPGESDGRMFDAGTYHPCLTDHATECSETCSQYVTKVDGAFQRSEGCQCGTAPEV